MQATRQRPRNCWSTNRKLDKAASKGVIHKNQAANTVGTGFQALNKL